MAVVCTEESTQKYQWPIELAIVAEPAETNVA